MRFPFRFEERSSWIGLGIVLVAFAASSCTPPIEASNYDQHCTKNSDCAVVEVGSPCHVCPTDEFDAVNISAVVSVESDTRWESQFCPRVHELAECASPQIANRPVCDGICTIPSMGTPCAAATFPNCTGTP
jgi:hypothetical protein